MAELMLRFAVFAKVASIISLGEVGDEGALDDENGWLNDRRQSKVGDPRLAPGDAKRTFLELGLASRFFVEERSTHSLPIFRLCSSSLRGTGESLGGESRDTQQHESWVAVGMATSLSLTNHSSHG